MALIQKNKENAQNLASLLSDAVDRGMVAKADEYSLSLLTLSEKESRIELSEIEWHDFLKSVRNTTPSFVSAYVLDTKDVETILASKFPEGCDPIRALLEDAKVKNAWILELPVEGEETEGLKNV
jgi:hypothetical protein